MINCQHSTLSCEVRLYAHSDRFSVLGMARAFHRESELPFEFDSVHLECTLREFSQGVDSAALVLVSKDRVHGVILGYVVDHPLWPVRMAYETLWYVDPEYRHTGGTLLLSVFEKWAASRSASYVGIALLGDHRRGLERYGYRTVEHLYMKEV